MKKPIDLACRRRRKNELPDIFFGDDEGENDLLSGALHSHSAAAYVLT